MSFAYARPQGSFIAQSELTRRCADIPLIKAVARKTQSSPFISEKALDACRNHAARLEATSKAYGFSSYHEAKVSLNTRRIGRFDVLGPQNILSLVKPVLLRYGWQAMLSSLKDTIEDCFRSAHHGPVHRKRLLTGILGNVKKQEAHDVYKGLTPILMSGAPSPHFNDLVDRCLGHRAHNPDMWVDRAMSLLATVEQVAYEIVLRDDTGSADHTDIFASYIRTPPDVFRLVKRCYEEDMVLPSVIGFHECLPGFSLEACLKDQEQQIKSHEMLGFLTMQIRNIEPSTKHSRSPR